MIETFLSATFAALGVGGAYVANGYFWNWLYRYRTSQDETFFFRAVDGWKLSIHHYRPEGKVRGLPVILCHGMGSNRYAFDSPGAPSLALFLRNRGRDVWVAELRGSGMSDRPGLLFSDVPYSWGFDDHLDRDLPPIISRVLELTGAPAAHWIGHSMGGMLIEAFLARHDTPPLASATAVGSPADFSKMSFQALLVLARLRTFLWLTPFPPMPFNGRLVLPIAHSMPRWLLGLFYPPNIDPRVSREIVALSSELLTSRKLWMDFGRFVADKKLASAEGGAYLDNLSESSVPLMVVAGSCDMMAPADSVTAACLPGPHKGERRCLIMGKESGCAEEYGHMDLLVGLRSEQEVYPHLLEWIEKHDG